MSKLLEIYERHIHGTERKAYVATLLFCLCNLKVSVKKVLNPKVKYCKVYASVRSIKHIYDRVFLDAQKSEDFLLILKNLPSIITNPDRVLKNKITGKGEFCFVRSISKRTYLVVVELDKSGKYLHLLTCFIPKNDDYYRDLEVIWEF